MTESKESIEAGIREVYNFVLERKNVTARYVVIIALASLWLDAYDFAAISFATKSVANTFVGTPSILISFGIGAVQFGAFVGAVVGGWLNDRVGRRNMFILNMILFVAMAILTGVSTNIAEFTIFRWFLGFRVRI